MRKTLVFFCLSVLALGQITGPARRVTRGAVDPIVCITGDVFFNTTSGTLKSCSAANTWFPAGANSSGAVSVGAGGVTSNIAMSGAVGGSGTVNLTVGATAGNGTYTHLGLTGNTAATDAKGNLLTPTGNLLPAPGLFMLPNVTFVRVSRHALTTDTTITTPVEVYTVPAGRRAIIASWNVYNSDGTSTDVALLIKVGALYMPLMTKVTVTTGASSQGNSVGYIAEAGEILAFHNDGTTPCDTNIWINVIEFDNTAGLKSVKACDASAVACSLTIGNNANTTLYTVPATKSAEILGLSLMPSTNVHGILAHVNYSGGARNFDLWFVPSGLAADSTTQTIPTTSNADVTRASFSLNGAMSAGDSVVFKVASNVTQQIVWMNVYEF